MDHQAERVRQALTSGPFAILDNNRGDSRSYVFGNPLSFLTAEQPDQVAAALAEIDEKVAAGHHALGYFSYELGYLFSGRLASLLPAERTTPLLCVGIFQERLEVEDQVLDAALANQTDGQQARILNCHLNMSQPLYLERLARVKQHIFDGDTYQVNYTLKYKFRHVGSPLRLYAELRKRQRVEYGAYLQFPGITVVSRSPELFIEKRDEHIHTRPMKGTSKRGHDREQDQRNAAFLSSDVKTRAENVMIVDLLRNDLSRISKPGTVRTQDLFKVETYETLHQMVSTVTAKVDADLPIERVLRQLFPCGSITGAPKVRTMEIIHDLECEPRGIYTGSIGVISPDQSMCLNVAIRTLALWPDGRGEMGIGSGIVHDSDPIAEYDECCLKGRFLTDNVANFHLIESLYCDASGYRFTAPHLDRIEASATALGFACQRGDLERELAVAAASVKAPSKVRLLLERDGSCRVEVVALEAPRSEERAITLAPVRVESSSWIWRHKISFRPLYDELRERYQRLGFYDVIFANERGELTEGTFNNLFLRRGARWYTPPLSCGVLPGVQRQQLLTSGERDVTEQVLTVDDLRTADEIYLTNAVRGLVRVAFVEHGEESACCA
jgi:para-aminobenzoate synthetase / 4-amino-4-deoxychorismate lyase